MLKAVWPDVERRDWIVMAGEDEYGIEWVGCGGHFVGTFLNPFLEIPADRPSGAYALHEFYRFENGQDHRDAGASGTFPR